MVEYDSRATAAVEEGLWPQPNLPFDMCRSNYPLYRDAVWIA